MKIVPFSTSLNFLPPYTFMFYKVKKNSITNKLILNYLVSIFQMNKSSKDWAEFLLWKWQKKRKAGAWQNDIMIVLLCLLFFLNLFLYLMNVPRNLFLPVSPSFHHFICIEFQYQILEIKKKSKTVAQSGLCSWQLRQDVLFWRNIFLLKLRYGNWKLTADVKCMWPFTSTPLYKHIKFDFFLHHR
jgi:hypothetical protein